VTCDVTQAVAMSCMRHGLLPFTLSASTNNSQQLAGWTRWCALVVSLELAAIPQFGAELYLQKSFMLAGVTCIMSHGVSETAVLCVTCT
jgi:hypothetical protein